MKNLLNLIFACIFASFILSCSEDMYTLPENEKLTEVNTTLSRASENLQPVTKISDIQNWTGTGSNSSILAIQWVNAKDITKPQDNEIHFLAWGYYWDSPTPTGMDMVMAIAQKDPRLYVVVGEQWGGIVIKGFAYDGDADRCIAVDENGNVVDGDRIMYVCGKYLMEQGKLKDNTVVTTIMSNLGLYKACDKIGMKYEQTAVGDKYVYENMLKNGYVLGGEQSGHIIFNKHARTGDGILTSLMVMEAIIEKKQTLGTLADEVKIFPQLLKNVRVKDKKTALDNAAVQAAVEKTAEELGTDGRILVRESGTEPVIRVMVEAESDELCNKYVYQMVDLIKEKGYAI